MPNRPVQLLLLALLALFGCDPQHDQYRQAMLRILHGDPATGARMLTALADNGYAPAQFRLGLLYRLGLGVTRHPYRAAYWFDKAARQNDVGGQYGLAQAYQRGDGVPKSPELAFQWFYRLAERGYAPAQYQVALAYAEGQGVNRDDLAAVQWLKRAATGAHLDAARRLAHAYRNGELGLLLDQQQAQKWEDKTQPRRF